MLIAIWSAASLPWLPIVDFPRIMTSTHSSTGEHCTAALHCTALQHWRALHCSTGGIPGPRRSDAQLVGGTWPSRQSCNAGSGDWWQLKLRWDQFSVSWIFKQFSHCWHWPCARPANLFYVSSGEEAIFPVLCIWAQLFWSAVSFGKIFQVIHLMLWCQWDRGDACWFVSFLLAVKSTHQSTKTLSKKAGNLIFLLFTCNY